MEPTASNTTPNVTSTPPVTPKAPIKPKTGCLGTTMILSVVVVLLLILFIPGCSKYNSMVTKSEAVTAQWAQVESKYQRRYDLIDNLVATVKGYATHENKTLTEVIEARSKASSININADSLDEKTISEFQAAQDGLKTSLSKLMVVVEAYPDLKASTGFLKLQAQLESTEDSINITRESFNTVTKEYNVYIKRFPNNIVAGICSFKEKAYFKADAEAQKAPKVKF